MNENYSRDEEKIDEEDDRETGMSIDVKA